MIPHRRLAALCVLLALSLPRIALAQRELHWDRLDVEARLDRAGRLHVTETQTLVLLHVPELVSPQPIRRLEREHDDVPEGEGRVMPTGEDEMRETAIAHVEEASVAESRTREREPAEHVSDRIGVVCDKLARDATARCYRRPPSPPRSRGRPLLRADRSAG